MDSSLESRVSRAVRRFCGGGDVRWHAHGTYDTFAVIDVRQVLAARFGDLAGLECLDLGSGSYATGLGRTMRAVPWRRLVCVEAHGPAAEQLRAGGCAAGEWEVREARIEDAVAQVPDASFDIVTLVDVIEHFPRAAALNLLVRAERIARRGVALFTPVGYVEQGTIDGNDLQAHQSGWDAADFARRGYDVDVYQSLNADHDPPLHTLWAIRAR